MRGWLPVRLGACSLGWRPFSKARMLPEQRPSAQTLLKGPKAHSWALTHTRTGVPAPGLPLPLSWRQWFSKEPPPGLFAVQSPHPLSRSSSNTVMPSRQLCGGSLLDHLKADGWAGSCGRIPRREEAALLLRPGHRLRQMDCLSPYLRRGSESGLAPLRRGILVGSPQSIP